MIISTDGVLAYLQDFDEIKSMLQRIWTCLTIKGTAILEFWTYAVNSPPSDSRRGIPHEITGVSADLLGNTFLCEVKKLKKLKGTRYRFYFKDKPFSYIVIKSDRGEEVHRLFFVIPSEIREELRSIGYEIVAEYGLGKKDGGPALATYNNDSKIWTVLVTK